MQIRISGPGAIFTSAKCRCREEALAPLQIFAPLAHACAQLSSESRVVFAASKRVTRNEPLFLVSKKRNGEPFNAVGSLALWSLKDHHVPHALSPSPFSFSRLSTRLSRFLLVAFAFLPLQVRRFYGRVEWYGRGIRQEARANRSVIVFTYLLSREYRLKKCLLFRDKYVLNVLSI